MKFECAKILRNEEEVEDDQGVFQIDRYFWQKMIIMVGLGILQGSWLWIFVTNFLQSFGEEY